MTIASSTTKPTDSVKRHQRQLVQAVSEQIHRGESSDDRQDTADPGINVAERFRRKRKITMTTRAMVRIRVNSTSSIEPRIDSEASNSSSNFTVGGRAAWSSGRSLRMLSTISNRIRSGLARHGKNDSARAVVPGDRFVVFDAVDDVGKFFEPQRDAVAPLDNQRPIGCGIRQLAGGLDRERLFSTVQTSRRKIHIALLDRALNFIDADPMRSELVGIHLDANRVFLSADTPGRAIPADRRDALGEHRLRVFVDGVQRQCVEVSAR